MGPSALTLPKTNRPVQVGKILLAESQHGNYQKLVPASRVVKGPSSNANIPLSESLGTGS